MSEVSSFPGRDLIFTERGEKSGDMSLMSAVAYAIGALASFHVAYLFPTVSFVIVGFLFCLCRLAFVSSGRKAFYFGLTIGMLIYAPHLNFFWTIFHAAAIALWLVLSVWLALFLLLAHRVVRSFQPIVAAIAVACLWFGFEYFRSELYYLRFAWLTAGGALSPTIFSRLFNCYGIYGIGFALALVAAVVAFTRGKNRLIGIGITAAVLGLPFVLPSAFGTKQLSLVRISGVQLEFREEDVVSALDRVVKLHPDTGLFVLSEYTFSGAPPREVRDWCKAHHTYLIAGGKDDTPDNFYNTAFVVGPSGEVVFKQAKSVPIQFFKDGLPAKEQKLWQSPWGKIGICICYDFSYRRVVDNLIEQGAQMLIVPTMDVVEWGDYQHRLHARVAPIHSAEFGVPIFRLCSSGISQAVAPFGHILSSAPFPGEGAILSEALEPVDSSSLPLDHYMAPVAVIITGIFMIYFSVIALRRKRSQTQNT